MEFVIVLQAILLVFLVWRVVCLGNLIEKMLKFQQEVKDFQDAQCELNLAQRGINNLFATEIDRMNFINASAVKEKV